MDSNGFNILPECPPLNKPPGFNGQHYTYWKQKMKEFLEASDVDMWDLIENGYNPPSKIEDGITVLKPRHTWSEEEKKKHLLASKVKWIISNSLWPNEYERVSNCSTAKEMWDELEIAHVGTNQVKASKVHTLVHEYELFKMHDGESIRDMVQRFTALVNHLGILGRRYENADLIHKVLRSLTVEWQPKITAIKESLKISMPSLQELFGNLEEHELELRRFSKNDEDKRRKGLALKVAECVNEEADELDSSEDLDEDEDIALLTKKYRRLIKAKKTANKRRTQPFKKNNSRTESQANSAPTCYECKKSGHIKPDCPVYLKRMLDNERKKKTKQPPKKANLATWGEDDIDSENEEEGEEEALLCLMAFEDSNEVTECPSDFSDSECDDLYQELYDDLVKAKKNINMSKKTIFSLETEIRALKEQNDLLISENESLLKKLENLDASSKVCDMCEILKAKVTDLNLALEKFTKGRKTLDTLLANQRIGLNKEGLGYEPTVPKRLFKNLFVRRSFGNRPNITCYYCGQKGHGVRECAYKKGTYIVSPGEKLVWMPKASAGKRTNLHGPKQTWVPPSK